MSSSFRDALTPTQREAVYHGDGPLLILAGPGSGKTRVVTHRIAYLLKNGVSADQVVALTFTNKAADEMRGRVQCLAPGKPVWMSTFHRFCSMTLRDHASRIGLQENFSIHDTSDSLRVLGNVIRDELSNLVHFTPEQILRAISWAKNNLITPEDYVPRRASPLGAIVAQVYPIYQSRLLACNSVDFDDLLMHVAVLLRDNVQIRGELDERFRYILVDEYQDTNLAQYAIVRALSSKYPNLSVTGDPDQSIYGWRGANLNNILEFERDYPGVRTVRLEQNFRSSGNIVCVADTLISNNLRRKQKAIVTDNEPGSPVTISVYADQNTEARGIAGQIAADIRARRRAASDFAIFYRVNALSRTFEHALADQGVPYQIVNSVEFYQRKEVKDVLAYLHLLKNPRNDEAFLRIINTPPRGIGKKTVERLRDYAQKHKITLSQAARQEQLVSSLHRRAATKLTQFMHMLDRIAGSIHGPVKETVEHVLAESGYRDHLENSEAPEDSERLANVLELVTAAGQYDQQSHDHGLDGFLEQAALVNDTDNWQSENDRVTLMTLHSAKGLEFPVVFIVAVEHGILPHERRREDELDLEEERRLFFVGITRAMQQLQISYVRRRDFRGASRSAIASHFLMELPSEGVVLRDPMRGSLEDSNTQDWQQENQAEPQIPRASGTGRLRALAAGDASHGGHQAKIVTAADLQCDLDKKQAKPASSFDAQPGAVVRHPEYGFGKIVAISGTGKRASATVQFFAPAEKRTFRLDHCELETLSSPR